MHIILKIKFLDIIIAAALTAGSAAGIIYQTSGETGGKAEIIFNDNVIDIINLEQNCDYHYNGSVSPVTVSVFNGKIRISESGCPRGLCMRQGEISREREIIVCIPNRIMITIVDGAKPDVDGITG